MKSREIDIMAVRRVATQYSQFIHIIVAEVKQGCTWICGDDSPPTRSAPTVVELERPAWFKALRPTSSSTAYSLDSDYLYGRDLMAPRFATSIHPVEHTKDAPDLLYAGVTTLVKASSSLEPPPSDNRHFWVVVPVLILDGNL